MESGGEESSVWSCECGKDISDGDFQFCPFCSSPKPPSDSELPAYSEIEPPPPSAPLESEPFVDEPPAFDEHSDLEPAPEHSDGSLQESEAAHVPDQISEDFSPAKPAAAAVTRDSSASELVLVDQHADSKDEGDEEVLDGRSQEWTDYLEMVEKRIQRFRNIMFASLAFNIPIVLFAHMLLPIISDENEERTPADEKRNTIMAIVVVVFFVALHSPNIIYRFVVKHKGSPMSKFLNEQYFPIMLVIFDLTLLGAMIVKYASGGGEYQANMSHLFSYEIIWLGAILLTAWGILALLFRIPSAQKMTFSPENDRITIHWVVGLVQMFQKQRKFDYHSNEVVGMSWTKHSKNKEGRGTECKVLSIDFPNKWRIAGNYYDVIRIVTDGGFAFPIDVNNIQELSEERMTVWKYLTGSHLGPGSPVNIETNSRNYPTQV